MNPPFPLVILIPLLVLALAAVAWLSWRGAAGLSLQKRIGLLALRLIAFVALAIVLLNPGEWVRPREDRERPWLLLMDRSASMAQTLEGGKTRADEAIAEAKIALDVANRKQVKVSVRPFDLAADAPLDKPEKLGAADGKGTDLQGSLRRAVDEAAAAGDTYAGVLALTDGRQTALSTDAQIESLALRLRSRNTPFSAVAIGAGQPLRDLELRATRPTVTVFKDQKARIPFAVSLFGLDPQKPEIVLKDEAGKVIARQQVEVAAGKPALGTFEVPAPDDTRRWSISTPALPDEMNPGNNESHVTLRLLNSKTRVFLAEGAPYWDSKFLAQLLRQQTQMEVHSVHHLSEDRYFRIDSTQAEPTESPQATFPDTLEEMSRYDLIVFGKNVDSFLTPQRLEALRSYVRDRGGAVLFARGKATTSSFPILEALEPVTWATATADDFRFHPVADGEAAGLFGDALPPPEASVWTALPLLKDARQISLVKPFTRVLAEGVSEGSTGLSGKFPTLMVRRYGQGVCGMVNGDGLWKWDFFPEARELGNMYEDFWTQLIQWMASYSEFMPGQNYSLRLPALRGPAGETVTVSMSYRGSTPDPAPVLRITSPTGKSTDLKPAAVPDPGGHPQWRASFTPDAPGAWKLAVVAANESSAPEASFIVPSPPAEGDNLAADPDFLERLAKATGGSVVAPDDLKPFLQKAFTPEPPSAQTGGAVWQPSWLKWPLALLIALPLVAEWYLRRRHGLA